MSTTEQQPAPLTEEQLWALAEKAYNYGRAEVVKRNPDLAHPEFSQRPYDVQCGFVEAVRFVLANR